MFEKIIDYLLDKACISIKYQVHRDMLKTPFDDPMMRTMRAEILQQPMVEKHLAEQYPDGWIGHGLHGGGAIEGHVTAMLGLGVEADSPCIQNAIRALLTPEISNQHMNYFAGGDALDADGRGGNRSIISWILAVARVSEETPPLPDEIRLSFNHLSGALDHQNVDDFSLKGSKCRYYKPQIKFPGANHINLLAKTRSWQTDESLKTAKSAMTHCYLIMKDLDESITFRKPKEYGGSFVGPFNFNWRALDFIDMPDLCHIVDNPFKFYFGFWLRTITGLPHWALQTTRSYELLAELLETDALMNIMTDNALQGFRHISGLEPNWRNSTAVKCDVTFAVLRACWPIIMGA